MARKKSAPSRMDLRRQADAAEAQEKDKDKEKDDEEVADEEPEDEADGDEDGDEKPKKKAKAKVKPATVKKPAVKRTRTPKEVRLKAIWVVLDNASKRVGTFPYAQKQAAEELMAQKIEEKKTTFYIQLVKEPLE